MGWREIPQKMVGGEHKIKDVCANCNNGPLSDLNNYAKGVLSNAGLLVDNFENSVVTLKYEYDTLLRWLLKVSFNSARVEGSHAPLFEPLTPFILDGKPTPSRSQIILSAQLLAPHIVTPEKRYELSPNISIGPDGKLNPLLMRTAWAPELESSKTCRLRALVIGPMVFYLMMFMNGLPIGFCAATFRSFLKREPHVKEIKRSLSLLHLRQSSTSWLDFYAPQIMRQKQLATDG